MSGDEANDAWDFIMDNDGNENAVNGNSNAVETISVDGLEVMEDDDDNKEVVSGEEQDPDFEDDEESWSDNEITMIKNWEDEIES